jgi:putative molybdopterin biosynthesis protein
MPTQTECLTIPQVADELKIAKSSVYELIKRHQLKAIKVLGKLRVRRHDLQRYLDLAGGTTFQRSATAS